jgi:hypothetical protein
LEGKEDVDKKLTIELVDNERKMMKMEEKLIKNFKKDDEKYPTPTSKEEAAKVFLEKEMNGKTSENFLLSFLDTAAKTLGPFYLDKFNSYQKKNKANSKEFPMVDFHFWW